MNCMVRTQKLRSLQPFLKHSMIIALDLRVTHFVRDSLVGVYVHEWCACGNTNVSECSLWLYSAKRSFKQIINAFTFLFSIFRFYFLI